jgi:glycosyltransferase involved in cell wall biosynthesis
MITTQFAIGSETPELMVVMPAFNEEASVRKVVLEFFREIEHWTEKFVFLCLNDGSTDRTGEVLNRLREQLGPRLEVVHQANQGHGQTCLEGYRQAIRRKIPWILQIDSDGQCDPQYFFRFWRIRKTSDVIYGVRIRRDDGMRRVFASKILRLFLWVAAGSNCKDANVPYRMMKTAQVALALHKIPNGMFLANVGLSVVLSLEPRICTSHIPIHFRERYGGEPKVPFQIFGAKAVELWPHLRALSKQMKSKSVKM